MSTTYYLPRKFQMGEPWAGYIRVVDEKTGQPVDKIFSVDLDAGEVEIQKWGDFGDHSFETEKLTGQYRLEIAAGAPKEALEWWKNPLGADKHVEFIR